MKARTAQRRYGLVLDGPVLTSATTEQGRVVAAGTLVADSAEVALSRWWDRVRPRGCVTVAVISDSAQVATVEIAPDVPAGLVRRHVESRLRSASPAHPTSFAVAARLADGDGPSSACVAAVPAAVMDRLWHAEGNATRFTVPAMAYTIAGVHLVVAHSASEVVLVDRRGRPADSVLLAAGGVPSDADPATRGEHAERVAEEVDRAVESWRRRGHDLDDDLVHVTGSGVTGDELFDALALRGYRPRLDLVTERLDADALRTAMRADRTAMARCVLAAAVAVCEPGPLGFLVPPGPRGASHPVARARGWLDRIPKQGAPRDGRRRLRPATVSTAAGCVLAVSGLALAAWAVPASIGARTVGAAASRHQRAVSVEGRLAPDIALAHHDALLRTQASALAGPEWDRIVTAILATLPPGVSLQSLDLSDQGATRLAVKVTASALGDALIPIWLSALRQAHVTASTPGVTVDRSGTATFSTTFAIPRDFG